MHRKSSSLIVSVLIAALPALAVEKSSSSLEQAKRLEAESQQHARMAAEFEKSPTMWEQKFPMSGRTAGHCRWLSAKLARQAAALRAKAENPDHPDVASRLEAESRDHARMATEFEESPSALLGRTAAHCRGLSERLARQAAEARAGRAQ